MIEILINLYIHHNYMKTDELINIKFKMCRSQYKFSINLVYNETMYDNKYNFMYNMIFVRTKLLIGCLLTCQPDHENRMADHIIFRF